jgi:tight adherence protein B
LIVQWKSIEVLIMTLGIGVVVFLVIFIAVIALANVLTAGDRKQAKQTIARLDAIASVPHAPENQGDLVDLTREAPLSSIAWLDALLSKLDLAAKVRLFLYQAGLEKWTVGKLLLYSACAALSFGCVVFLRTRAVPLCLLSGFGAAALPFLYIVRKRASRFDRIRQLLPEALDLMVAAIRAGHSFSSAIGMASKESPEPMRSEFRQCFDEQNFGLDTRVAMSNLAYRVPIHEVRVIVTAILIQREAGGNLTEILEKVAYLIREDFRLQRQVRVHTAQGRLTGWILSILPVVLGFLLYLFNPENMSLLWQRPVGLKLLYGAAAMTLMGALIIRKIVRVRI